MSSHPAPGCPWDDESGDDIECTCKGQVLSAEAFNCQHIRVQGLTSDLPHTPGWVFVLALHVWHLGVESLDLSTCRLILCFHLREKPSHWGSATAWARNSYVMSPVYVFRYG